MDDISLTGSAPGLERMLQDICLLAIEIYLTLNFQNCGWWPGLTETLSPQRLPLLHSVLQPKGLNLFSVPLGDTSFIDASSQRLLAEEDYRRNW